MHVVSGLVFRMGKTPCGGRACGSRRFGLKDLKGREWGAWCPVAPVAGGVTPQCECKKEFLSVLSLPQCLVCPGPLGRSQKMC